MTVSINIRVTGETERHGLKAIQQYFNLEPDGRADLIVNGLECGEVNAHNVGMLINDGLRMTLMCRRCQYKWRVRGETAPKFCPGCNSPYWNRERRV
jgi:rubrerythrin